MGLKIKQIWVNFLSLLPGTTLTVTTIAIAFLRFYDQQDFSILGKIAHPRTWSNRLTVAAILVAMVAFGVEWNRRNRETARLDESERTRIAEAARVENERTQARDRRREEEERRREDDRRRIAEAARVENERTQARQREARRDYIAAEERNRASEERNRADRERERAVSRARIQNRWIILQIQHQLQPTGQTRAALRDFMAFLREYGE